MNPHQCLLEFHEALKNGQSLDPATVNALAVLLEASIPFRDQLVAGIIDPGLIENLSGVPEDSPAGLNSMLGVEEEISIDRPGVQGVTTRLLKNPSIQEKIKNGGNDFQRVIDGADLLLRIITGAEMDSGDGFSWSDHPQALAGVAYLFWYAGVSGHALMYASVSEMMRPVPIVGTQDLLPKAVAMLVRNQVHPSHRDSMEADYTGLKGFNVMEEGLNGTRPTKQCAR